MRRLVCWIVLAGAVVSGCSDQTWPPLTVVNRTDGPIEITIVGQPDTYSELPMTVPPSGGIGMIAGPFQFSSTGCIAGSLIATQDGREIARKDQPCGGTWEVTESAPTTASPS